MTQNEALVDFDDDAIRRIAYDLWERRGAPIGSPDVDWIEAERWLREERLDLPADGQQSGTIQESSRRTPARPNTLDSVNRPMPAGRLQSPK
jgi:hypothetical protein